MKKKVLTWLAGAVILIRCSSPEQLPEGNLYHQTQPLSFIEGKRQYLSSPFVTAGDRVYMAGNQDGTFPDLGWHIQGEMGGIWDHPIKLMDGFAAEIAIKGTSDNYCINQADQFVNYPIGNKHHFIWDKQEMTIERFQFIPDGMEGVVIEYRFINHSTQPKEITFSFTGMTDLRPTWLGERTKMTDARDKIQYDKTLKGFIAKDSLNDWYTAFGSLIAPDEHLDGYGTCAQPERKGLGAQATLRYHLALQPNGAEIILPIYIAGSYQSDEEMRQTYGSLRDYAGELLEAKINRFKNIEMTSTLNIPDKGIQQMFEWLKYNTDWLVRSVPDQGTGLSAGLPDYPWWFGCDNTYALQGVLATGDHQLVKSTIKLLHDISSRTNRNGRIIHETSTNGSVFNPGNVNETPQFITLLRNYYRWTGDKELIAQLFPDVKKGIAWLLEEMDPDRNGYPNGSGMMEIHGLDTEMIDVAVYTQQGLASAAELATALNETNVAANYQKLADALAQKINNEWWQPREKSYGDFRGTAAIAMPVLDAALIRADTLGKPWAVNELKQLKSSMGAYSRSASEPYVIYHNWVVNTPLETGIADPDKAKMALQTVKKYENPFGVFVTGIDRTTEPDSVVLKSRRKTFSYTGAVMTLPTGLEAIAASNYGYPDEALGYLHKLHNSFSYALPGSMYEVSPDFGMMTQAWNIYGVAVTIVKNFLGIRPNAGEKSITIFPQLPSSWPEAAIDNVHVGNNTLSLAVIRKENGIEYRIRQSHADWKIMIPITKVKKVMVNDKEVEAETIAKGLLELTGKDLIVRIVSGR